MTSLLLATASEVLDAVGKNLIITDTSKNQVVKIYLSGNYLISQYPNKHVHEILVIVTQI